MYDSIWPTYIGSINNSGLSNQQLEQLCADTERSEGRGIRFPAWFRTSEAYGHGTSFRQIAGWPRWLPIPVQSDHGVNIDHQLAPEEEDGLSPVFLTWPEWRLEMTTGKKIMRVLNPLVAFRRMNRIRQRPDANGTLVFIPHTTNDRPYPDYDWKKYFDELDDLPEALRPRAICLSRVEVQKGLHLVLRSYGLPIFSLGMPGSLQYAARFYDLISRFKFATSSSIGSQLWYCEELGVKYFLHGASPFNVSKKQLEPWVSSRLRMYNELYSEIPPRSSPEKDREVEAALFTSQSVDNLKHPLRRLFWKQLILLFPAIAINFLFRLTDPEGRRMLRRRLNL